jgi:hypothetical protein
MSQAKDARNALEALKNVVLYNGMVSGPPGHVVHISHERGEWTVSAWRAGVSVHHVHSTSLEEALESLDVHVVPE